MKPRLNFINLAVHNLEKSLEFYRDGLGFSTAGVVDQELCDEVTGARGTIAYFELQPGLMLGLYERSNLAKDAGLEDMTTSSLEFSLGHAVETKADVAALLERAKQAGATITVAPRDRPWGVYSAYFLDPEGHLWEVSCKLEN